MTNYQKLHSMTEHQLAHYLDSLHLNNAPWERAFDVKYCKNCQNITIHPNGATNSPTHDVTLAYCEVYGICVYFKRLSDVPTDLDIIKWWLHLDANSDK